MALPRRLAITTRLTGHPGSRHNIPWDSSSSLSLRRRSFSSDSVSESDVPPDIWILLEDLDLYLYEKEVQLDAIVLLVEETLGISLSLISTSTWPPDPSGAQLRVKESSNNSLETSSGDINPLSSIYPSPAHTPQQPLSPIVFPPELQRYPFEMNDVLSKELSFSMTSHEKTNDQTKSDAMPVFLSSPGDEDEDPMPPSVDMESDDSFDGDLYTWLVYQGNFTKSPIPSAQDATSSSSAPALVSPKLVSPSLHSYNVDKPHPISGMAEPLSTSMPLSPPPTVKFPSLVMFPSPTIQPPSVPPISNTATGQHHSPESVIAFRRTSKSNLASDTIVAAHIKLQNALRAHDDIYERPSYSSKETTPANNEDSAGLNESTPQTDFHTRSNSSLGFIPKSDGMEECNMDVGANPDEGPSLLIHRQFRQVIAEMKLNRSSGPPKNSILATAELKSVPIPLHPNQRDRSNGRSEPSRVRGEENEVSDEARADAVALKLLEESVLEQQQEKALRVLADRLRETAAKKRSLAAALARM